MRENLEKVGDTGEESAGRYCQDNRRGNLGRSRLGSIPT